MTTQAKIDANRRNAVKSLPSRGNGGVGPHPTNVEPAFPDCFLAYQGQNELPDRF
jgi:hypothetical protein